VRRYAHTKFQLTVRHSNFDMARRPCFRGNVPVDPSGTFENRTGRDEWRAGHTYGIAAHRRAARCRHWNFDGVDLLRPRFLQAWSRHVVIAMFTLIIVYASILGALDLIRHSMMWRAVIDAAIFGGLSAWYFYFKRNVATYFRESAS